MEKIKKALNLKIIFIMISIIFLSSGLAFTSFSSQEMLRLQIGQESDTYSYMKKIAILETVKSAYDTANRIFDFDHWPSRFPRPLEPEVIFDEKEAIKYPEAHMVFYDEQKRRTVIVYPNLIKRIGNDDDLYNAVMHEYVHALLCILEMSVQLKGSKKVDLPLHILLFSAINKKLTQEGHTAEEIFLALNLYEDLIINVFLQRYHSIDFTDYWRILVIAFEIATNYRGENMIKDAAASVENDARTIGELVKRIVSKTGFGEGAGLSYFNFAMLIGDESFSCTTPFCNVISRYLNPQVLYVMQHDTEPYEIQPLEEIMPSSARLNKDI